MGWVSKIGIAEPILIYIGKLLSQRLFQCALSQPVHKSACFPLVECLLSNTLIFVIFASEFCFAFILLWMRLNIFSYN